MSYKPNPELYKELSQPVTAEEAQAMMVLFFEKVQALRVEMKIPELIFSAGVWVGEELVAVEGTFGDAKYSPRLAKGLYENIAVKYVDRMLEK